jgi:glycolate oxidase iron-sulfur subunit
LTITNTKNNGAPQCVKCGACTTVCPVYRETGRESHSARGKHHILAHLAAADRTGAYKDLISKCLLCGACREVCSRDLETPRLVIEARREFSRLSPTSFLKYISNQALANPRLRAGLLTAGSAADRMLSALLPADSGLRLRLTLCRPEILTVPAAGYIDSLAADDRPDSGPQSQAACSYFVGCLANYLKPEIGAATVRLTAQLAGSPPAVPERQTCCGMAALAAGDLKQARQLAQKNIDAFAGDKRPILTSCASCYSHLLSYPDLFDQEPDWQRRAREFAGRVREFACFFNAAISARPAAYFRAVSHGAQVLYHDPCHLRSRLHITAEPRQLLSRLPEVLLLELENGPQCCGQGGFFHISHPDIAGRIRDRLMRDFAKLPVRTVVSTCSGCLLQWQQALADREPPCRVAHLAVFMEEHLHRSPGE